MKNRRPFCKLATNKEITLQYKTNKMKLNSQELEKLEASSLNLSGAKTLADFLTIDPTAGGVFPNGNNGIFDNPDIERFKKKYCPWWPVARKLLMLAKIFTNDTIDRVIDALIELGDGVCE